MTTSIYKKYVQDIKENDVIIYNRAVYTVLSAKDTKDGWVTLTLGKAGVKGKVSVDLYPLSSYECLLID